MKKIILLLIVLACPALAQAQTNPAPVLLAGFGTSPDSVTPFIAAICDDPAKVTTVVISTASSGNTQLVALSSNQIVYGCGYDFIAGGTVNVKLTYGTGTTCGTGTVDITGAYPLTAQTGLAIPNTGAVQFKGAVSNAVCINLSTTVQVSGVLKYVRQ